MNFTAVLCFVGFVFLLITMFKRSTDIFSPGRLFAMVWLLAIGMTELKLSRFQYEWSFYSWIMLLIPLISFLLGVYCLFVTNFNKKLKPLFRIRLSNEPLMINERKLFVSILVLFGLFLISYYVTYKAMGYLPILVKYKDAANSRWGIFGFGLFIEAVPIIIFLSSIYFIIPRVSKVKKINSLLIIIISFILYVTLLQRFYLILSMLLIFIAVYYLTGKMSTKNVLIMTAIVILIIYGISSIRLSRYEQNIVYYLSDMKYSPKYSFITEPYMYVCMNLENYAKAVERLTKHTYGYFSADWILALSGLKHNIQSYCRIDDRPFVITSSFNTYTTFYSYYSDFGIIGVFIIPYALGLIVSSLYFRMRNNPNIHTVSIYALCVFIMLFSFFIPILHWLHFVFNAATLYFITRVCVKKEHPASNCGGQ